MSLSHVVISRRVFSHHAQHATFRRILQLQHTSTKMGNDTIICCKKGNAIIVVGAGAESKKIKVDTHIIKAVSESFDALGTMLVEVD